MINPEQYETPQDFIHGYEQAFRDLRRVQALRDQVVASESRVVEPRLFMIGCYVVSNVSIVSPCLNGVRTMWANRLETRANQFLQAD